MYGHTARIWRIKPFDDLKSEGLSVVTASEDATVRIWSIDFDGQWSEIACL